MYIPLHSDVELMEVSCECGNTLFWVAATHPGPYRCCNCNLIGAFENEGGAVNVSRDAPREDIRTLVKQECLLMDAHE